MGRPKQPILLTDDERDLLHAWLTQFKSSPSEGARRRALRARIVLACAEGLDNVTVAARLGVSQNTVCKWRSRFVRDRLAGLEDVPRPGVPPRITDAQVEDLLRRTLEATPPGAERWSRRVMARATGLSRSTVDRIWRTFGLSPQRGDAAEVLRASLSPQIVRAIAGLYLFPPSAALAVMVDAGALPAPDSSIPEDRVRPLLPVRPAQVSIAGAPDWLSPLLDTVAVRVPKSAKGTPQRRPKGALLQFLTELERMVPEGFGLHVVLDGHRPHHGQALATWLAEHPRVQVHIAPTHPPFVAFLADVLALVTEGAGGAGAAAHPLVLALRAHAARPDAAMPFVWTAPRAVTEPAAPTPVEGS
jgi:transposase